MKCLHACHGHCSTPYQCGLSTRLTQSNGGESVDMPVSFAGPEPITLPWWAVAIVTILALIGAGALYGWAVR